MSNATPLPVLGVDIGGVITGSTGGVDGEDTFLGSRRMDAPVIDGVFEALHDLAERFDYRVWLVSKAGPRVCAISRGWLHHVGLWEATATPRGNLKFVPKRADKAPVCQRVGATHFVDDRLDVLEHLRPHVGRLHWFQSARPTAPRWATTSSGAWPDMRRHILRDLAL